LGDVYKRQVITVVMNIFLIPVYGYMASAWAHVASYSAMIVLSFIFAAKHYRIEYKMIQLLPYFITAIAIVAFTRLYKYSSLAQEMIINTILLILFVLLAQLKDRTLTVFFRKS
ncbi:MAG: polysaccharide biosynthesis C-terminal domain-containing protein, partial [Methanosarcina sp.]|nr:polysaccharide biosynthesis C-terminal domain-containing protein [Methanosarcina sp.]